MLKCACGASRSRWQRPCHHALGLGHRCGRPFCLAFEASRSRLAAERGRECVRVRVGEGLQEGGKRLS